MGAGYLQSGYYFGFFVAAALNFTVGAHYGWRAMFLCGAAPVVVSLFTLMQVKEPDRWERVHTQESRRASPFAAIFSRAYLRRTLVMSCLLTVAIVGLWAGSVYVPTAVTTLAKAAGHTAKENVRFASLGTGILSLGTILGCIVMPMAAERLGRRLTLAFYFAGMAACIALAFGWAFYLPPGQALPTFLTLLFFLGFCGGNFAVFSLWLPELFGTKVRATAFAFCTSVGRFIGAGVNFALGAAVHAMGTLGTPVALTAVAFGVGILVIPLATETKGERLPA
jgi:MFS family permease